MRHHEQGWRLAREDGPCGGRDSAVDRRTDAEIDRNQPVSAAAVETESHVAGHRPKVIPVLGGSRHFCKLLEGLVEKHGSHTQPVDSVFDLMQLVQQFQPSAVFVSLETLLRWNTGGIEQLNTSESFQRTRIVPFTERWQREELPEAPGLDRSDTLCVPLSITHLEAIIQHHVR